MKYTIETFGLNQEVDLSLIKSVEVNHKQQVVIDLKNQEEPLVLELDKQQEAKGTFSTLVSAWNNWQTNQLFERSPSIGKDY